MVPKFNGLDLPGFELPNTRFPRWCIVWDDKGWTTPVRRVIMGFYGKVVDSDGNSWDHCSDIPYEYRSLALAEWTDVSLELVNQLRNKSPKYCIHCGRPILLTEDYVQGRICGQSNAIMCMECATGDGAKYIEGSYGDRAQAWREARPEQKDDRNDHKQLNLERFIEFGSAILVGIGFFVMLLLYVAELFQ